MSVTIYHNPSCSTSRNVLAMIRASGEEPKVINYLTNPPTRKTLLSLIKRLKLSPRELLRRSGTPYDELGLDDPRWSDDELVELMLAHPILIQRPIVIAGRKIVLARPSEKVFDILPNPVDRFEKEDGKIITAKR
jgi:arsenate reductase